jgi:hypothetical protein
MNNIQNANLTAEEIDQLEWAAYEEACEAEQWEREQAQVRWAEAGGYRANLSRPAY